MASATLPKPTQRRGGFGLPRLIAVSLLRRRSRVVLAVLALSIGAALTTALLTVYHGVEENLAHEFRTYGANVVVTPPSDRTILTASEVQRLRQSLPGDASAVGVLYLVGTAGTETRAPENAILAGVDFAALARLNPTWKVSGGVAASPDASALPPAQIGVKAMRQLGLRMGDTVQLGYGERSARVRVAATVESGESEDNQIFVPAPVLQKLSGLAGYTTLQILAVGGPAQLQQVLKRERAAVPAATVSAVRRIASSEGRILLSTGGMLLAASLLVLLTIALCVAAALTTMALERRHDFGIMKALGAAEGAVFAAFVGEGLVLGLLAFVLGGGLGTLLAGAIGQSVFGVWLRPDVATLAIAAAATLLLAALAALAPWPVVRGATPAAILRGE